MSPEQALEVLRKLVCDGFRTFDCPEALKTLEAIVLTQQTTNISVMPCPFHRVGELCFLKNLADCSMEACLIHRARE